MLKSLRKYYQIHFSLLLLFVFASFSVIAQESEPAEQEAAEVTKEELAEEDKQRLINMQAGPKLRELEVYTASLLNGLEKYQAQYIYKIRQEFGVIRSVQVVKSDIGDAVKSCKEENPSIEEKITSRFESWNSEIISKLASADAALKEAIQRQSFRPTVRVNMLLDHVQAAFEERDSQLQKVPVTTLEACENLLKSLDNTEESLKTLIDETTKKLNELSTDPEKTAAADIKTPNSQ